MRLLFLTVLSLGIVFTSPGQSLSGNLSTGRAMEALGYGNVDIYRGDELVASVFTDRWGNFHVPLDTGLYKCVVSYDGYEPSSRMVKVKADETMDFSVKEDASRPARKPLPAAVMEDRMSEGARDHAFHESSSSMERERMLLEPTIGTSGLLGPGGGRVGHGRLTAGEVNDFSKWTQWEDLSATTLGAMRTLWSIAPYGRYTLDLQMRNGLPIADAVVHLERKDGTKLFSARTDNTGKAELWAALDARAGSSSDQLLLAVEYGGRTIRVDRAKPFAQGVNRLVLDVPCGPSDNVDVAFVVDATGSMQDELDFLRAEMNDIIFRSKQIGDRLNFRFANVFYRDVGSSEAYLTRSMDFTRVLSAAVNFISDQRADGGGDTPEAVEVALDSAINHLSWSTDARTRIIFLVLDAGPHNTPEVRKGMQVLMQQAAAKGIRIVTLAASGVDKGTEYLMRTLALGTNGTYTFLTDHSGIGAPHIEPSTDHYDVESLNNLLVRVLKSYTYMPDCTQQIPELELGYPDSVVAVTAPRSDTASTDPDGPTGLPTAIPRIRWSYWPNPTSGIVHIKADTAIAELYITDLSGKVLQLVKGLKADEPVQVDLSAYATGVYLIRYPYGTKWLSGQVVLQRS
ncbi:MAG: VWA domain-containing protein [Flavobacteriales bacterium]|jgi:hypothetical protein|nr:VWA domain-containing protein [Flavobacteriales bacterium]